MFCVYHDFYQIYNLSHKLFQMRHSFSLYCVIYSLLLLRHLLSSSTASSSLFCCVIYSLLLLRHLLSSSVASFTLFFCCVIYSLLLLRHLLSSAVASFTLFFCCVIYSLPLYSMAAPVAEVQKSISLRACDRPSLNILSFTRGVDRSLGYKAILDAGQATLLAVYKY